MSGKSPFEKRAYDYGAVKALLQVVKIAAAGAPKREGKETRLKLDHNPHDFFSVKRTFQRAGSQTKDVGTHIPLVEKKEEEDHGEPAKSDR